MSHRFSLLSSTAIRETLGAGVIIEPFDPKQLKTCSYDMRLGEWYYRMHGPEDTNDTVFNPIDPAMVARYYGEAQQAQFARSLRGYVEGGASWQGIDPDDRIIMMHPGEMILGHTLEFIGGTKDPATGRCFTAEMKARSSAGRLGFEICRCAGWGDVGYVNRWTMEIVCTAKAPIILVAGTRLAQMKFYEVAPVDDAELYGADGARDHYQSGVDLAGIMASWQPTMMIPRLSKR